MSLQVWLPLNGNLDNQGLTQQFPVTQSSTISYATTGKTSPSCISFNGSNQHLHGTVYLTNTMTFALWVYFDEINGAHLLDCRSSNGGIGYQPMYIGNSTSIQVGGTNSAFPYIYLSSPLQINTWYHLTVVYTPTDCSLYLNGKYVNKSTSAKGVSYNQNILWSLATRCSESNHAHVRVNDLRIYDNALTAEEIAELAKGLVLHYPLARSAEDSGWLEPNETSFITRASGNTFYDYTYNNNLKTTTDRDFIVDFWSKGTRSDLRCDFYFRNSAGSAYALTPTQYVTTSWKHYRLGFTGDPAALVLFRARCYGGTVGDIIYFNNVKLLSANCPNINQVNVVDISGYQNHGTVINTTLLSDNINNLPRYNQSLLFNGSNSGILISNKGIGYFLNNPCTYSFWMKSVGEDGGRTVYLGSYSLTPGINLEKNANNAFRYWWAGNPDQVSASNLIKDGSWIHICFVRESTTSAKLYINGVLKQTFTGTTNALTNPADIFRIGRDSREGATCYHGYMSDVRLFVTPLTQTDVEKLYKMGV